MGRGVERAVWVVIPRCHSFVAAMSSNEIAEKRRNASHPSSRPCYHTTRVPTHPFSHPPDKSNNNKYPHHSHAHHGQSTVEFDSTL